MKRTLLPILVLALVIFEASLHAKTIEVSVSQVTVITPPQGNQDPALGPRICLKFDLPEEVTGVEIGFAEVVLNIDVPAQAEDSLAVFEVFALGSDWREGATWGDFPIPGGDADSNFYSNRTIHCGRDNPVSLDITEMAQEWNAHPEANFGLILIPRRTDWRAIREARFMPEQIRSRVALRILVPGRNPD